MSPTSFVVPATTTIAPATPAPPTCSPVRETCVRFRFADSAGAWKDRGILPAPLTVCFLGPQFGQSSDFVYWLAEKSGVRSERVPCPVGGEDHPNVRAIGRHRERAVHAISPLHAVFYRRSVYEHLLRQADAVVHVMSAINVPMWNEDEAVVFREVYAAHGRGIPVVTVLNDFHGGKRAPDRREISRLEDVRPFAIPETRLFETRVACLSGCESDEGFDETLDAVIAAVDAARAE